MRFLIDGYNLLHLLGFAGRYVGPRSWERSRRDLLQWIAKAHGQQLDLVTVIFDAERAAPNLPPVQTIAGVRVRFAQGQLADDLLEEIIQRETQPRTLTVVSSDRRVQQAAQRRNCVVMDCRDYIDRALDAGHELPKPPPTPTKPQEATPEETAHWLREFADLDEDKDLRRFNRPFEEFEQE